MLLLFIVVVYSAKLDQEIRRDETTLNQNKSSKDQYQTLLNQKVVYKHCLHFLFTMLFKMSFIYDLFLFYQEKMVTELQRIKSQLAQNRTRRY